MEEQIAYDREVDAWVVASLPTADTFPDLVRRLPGVYPAVVLESLQRVGKTLAMGSPERLLRLPGPIPHPVDGDWRFHPRAHDIFVRLVKKFGSKAVCVLASPSLVTRLKHVAKDIALADANAAWKPYLDEQGIHCLWDDVSGAIEAFPREFDMVIVDPPWYPGHFRRFLSVAATVVRRKGIVLLSWPGRGTRPGLRDEWTSILEFSAELGLEVVQRDELLLPYATPFYEGRALQAAKLPVIADWRCGDLVIFTAQRKSKHQPETGEPNDWLRKRWRTLDLRIRNESKGNDPRLISILQDDVLPTVSRRDPRRSEAAVWTSGNRVFGCKSPSLLYSIIDCLHRGDPRLSTLQITESQRHWALEAVNHIAHIERLEIAEYDALHESAQTE